MGEKESKWLEHLKAAQSSGLKLSAYAANHQIDVRRLYEAKRKRAQQAVSNWAVVRVRPDAAVDVAPKAREWVAPTSAASRCMNSSGDITRCVVPSRQAVLSLSTTWPAALI